MKRFNIYAASLAIALCLAMNGAAYSGEEKTETKAEKTEAKADTAANRALDQKITLEKDGVTLTDMLVIFEEKGVQYVINTKVTENEDEFVVKVKDLPLREVIELTAASAGYKVKVSKSGIVTFVLDSEQAEAIKIHSEMKRMEAFMKMRGDRNGGDRQRPGGDRQRPGGRERPNRDNNKEGAQDGGDNGGKKGEVF